MHTKDFSSVNNPTITVVMPVYDVAPYVERCIQSVMGQTYPATECIIVDDASTDDSISRCQRLIDEYSGPTKFIIIYHECNRGLSAARNTGTDASTSDYIYYLDSDDEMTPDCLEKLVSPVTLDDSIEMVMGNFRYDYSTMPGKSHRLEQWLRNRLTNKTFFAQDALLKLQTNEEVRKWFYNGKCLRPNMICNKLLKLSFLRENRLYNREGILFEESLWTFYLMRCLSHVVFIHDVTYIYYQRPKSIMTGTKKDERIKHMGYTFREIAEQIKPGERIEETEWIMQSFCKNFIYASGNVDYLYAYNVFRGQLSCSGNHSSVCILSLTYYLAKNRLGKWVFKVIMRVVTWCKIIMRLVF